MAGSFLSGMGGGGVKNFKKCNITSLQLRTKEYRGHLFGTFGRIGGNFILHC